LLGSYVAWRLAATGGSVVVFEKGIAGDGSTGFNGHGIMHGPTVADALCATTTGTSATAVIDLGPLAPERFAEPRRQRASITLI
jgi:glycine/D-amino acid oxidase-like deaminating enzyme